MIPAPNLAALQALTTAHLKERYPELLAILKALTDAYGPTVEQAGTLLARGGTEANDLLGKLQSNLNNLAGDLRALDSPGALYKRIHRLQSAIATIRDQNIPALDHFPNLVTRHLAQFEESVDRFLTSRSPQTAFHLVLAAHDLHVSLQQLDSSVGLTSTVLQTDAPVPSGWQSLTLVFDSNQRPTSVADKLRALAALYSELAQLLDESEADYPLELRDLHAGSLIVTILGSAAVTGLLAKFIASAAKWVFRHATRDAALESLPKGLSALDQAIGIREKLKAIGCDTSGIDPTLEKAGVTLANNLNQLFANEPSVTIDSERLSLTQMDALRLLQARQPKHLGPGKLAPDSTDAV